MIPKCNFYNNNKVEIFYFTFSFIQNMAAIAPLTKPYLKELPIHVINEWLTHIITDINFALPEEFHHLEGSIKGKPSIIFTQTSIYIIKDLDVFIEIKANIPKVYTITDIVQMLQHYGISNIQVIWKLPYPINNEDILHIRQQGYIINKNYDKVIISRIYDARVCSPIPINESQYIACIGMQSHLITNSIRSALGHVYTIQLPNQVILNGTLIALRTSEPDNVFEYTITSDIIYKVNIEGFDTRISTQIQLNELSDTVSRYGITNIILEYAIPQDIVIDYQNIYTIIPNVHCFQYYDGQQWLIVSSVAPFVISPVPIRALRMLYNQDYTMQIFMGG